MANPIEMRELERMVAKRINVKQVSLNPVSGGDINEAFEISTTNGKYFLKCNSGKQSHSLFDAEKHGLETLQELGKVVTPGVVDLLDIPTSFAGLILAWIDPGRPTNQSWLSFGNHLANLHRVTSDNFGLERNNFIGSLVQENDPDGSWMNFYYEKRIAYQIRLAVDKALLNSSIHKKTDRMFAVLESDIPDEIPALIHGDLWSGNLLFNNEGTPVFIDPAICFASREMDIAMINLFGGFNSNFLLSYNEIYPLENNWKDRLKFYQLYYILVHVNLFGGHYIRSAESIINYYGDKSA